MKKFDRTRGCFVAPVEIDIESRCTVEERTVLKYHDIASAVKQQTPVTPEELQELILNGTAFFCSFKLVFLTGTSQVHTNVAFTKATFKEGAIHCEQPTTNPYVEQKVVVPLVVEDGMVYCDLTELTADLEEWYVV